MMGTDEYIFFDCMETLIDLKELPGQKDYAAWTFYGSGVEDCWRDFDQYYEYYTKAKQSLSERLPEYGEYDVYELLTSLTKLSSTDISDDIAKQYADKLFSNYWENYSSRSFVRKDVKEALPRLKRKYRLGVVSNFMVFNGIEMMLNKHDIRKYFEFVVTSVSEGWRKPHRAIYDKALKRSGVIADSVIFVGDDFLNDYTAPTELGIRAVYLDRFERHPEIKSRVANYSDLCKMLLDG